MDVQPGPIPVEERSGEVLADLQDRLEADDAEMASLFGVAPIAMEEWRRHGVPPARAERLQLIRAVVRRLDSHGRERPVAELVRRPLPLLHGRTLLDALRQGDPRAVTAATDADALGLAAHAAATRPFSTRPRGGEAHVVGDLMTREPVTVGGGASIREAARLMRGADTGDLVVIDGGRPVAMLTDRDIVLRVVAPERDPGRTAVRSIVRERAGLVSVASDVDLDDAVRLMRQHAVRRLPVVDRGLLVGLVSLADIVVERQPDSLYADIVAAPPSD